MKFLRGAAEAGSKGAGLQRNHQGRDVGRRAADARGSAKTGAWAHRFGSGVVLALALGLGLALGLVPGARAQNNGGVYQDEIQTQGEDSGGAGSGGGSGGGDSFSTGDLPGGEDGGPCEDTSAYDRVYGGPPVRISLKSLGDPLYQRHPEILLRCAADRCAINETALCWINKKALAAAEQDPAVAADRFYTQSDEGDDSYGCPADPAWTAQQQAWWNQTYCKGVGSGGGSGGGGDSYNTASTGNGGSGTGGGSGGTRNNSGGGGSGGGGTTTASNTPPDGSKSIYREEPNPDPSGKFAADIRKILAAMDDCLRVKGGLGYYQSPKTGPGRGLVGYDPRTRTVSYDVGALRNLPPRQQAFALGGGMGEHVLSLEARRYGPQGSSWEDTLAIDYIAGYLSHCVERRGLVPTPTNADNVPAEFEAFVLQNSVLNNSTQQLEERRQNFNEGWGAWGARLPIWLTHD